MSNLILDGNTTEIPAEVDSELTRIAGLSYATAEAVQQSFGTTPGCHQPLLYTVSRLVSERKINSILELGSGMTTIFFQALSKRYKIPVVSIENHFEWYEKTMQSLTSLDLDGRGYQYSEKWFDQKEIGTIHGGPFDLILIDHAPAVRTTESSDRLHRMAILSDIMDAGFINERTIIMWDDCEQRQRYEATIAAAQLVALPVPKLWQSQSRGISTVDQIGLIDFIKYKWEQ